MSAFPHTSAPWDVHSSGDDLLVCHYVGNGNEEVICSVHAARRPEIREANARLIAAAPKLLAAYVELLGTVEIDCLADTDEEWLDLVTKGRSLLAEIGRGEA